MGSKIQRLEELLKGMQSAKTINNRGRAEIRKLKRQISDIYITSKKSVLDFEKKNYKYLVFLQSTNGFHKLIENSALFFACDIADRLNLTANMQTDGDFDAKSEVGIVSVRLDNIKKRLESAGIKPVEMGEQIAEVVFYELPEAYTPKQVEDLRNHTKLYLEQFNQIVLPTVIFPALYAQLNEALLAVYHTCRKMTDTFARDVLGKQMFDDIGKAERVYLEMAAGTITDIQGLEMIQTLVRKIKWQTKIFSNLNIWTPKNCVRIGKILQKLEKILALELKQRRK